MYISTSVRTRKGGVSLVIALRMQLCAFTWLLASMVFSSDVGCLSSCFPEHSCTRDLIDMLPSARSSRFACHIVDNEFVIFFSHDQVGSCVRDASAAYASTLGSIGRTLEEDCTLLAGGHALPFWLESRKVGDSIIQIFYADGRGGPHALAGEGCRSTAASFNS